MTTQINYTNSSLNATNLTVSGQAQFTSSTSAPTCSTTPLIGNELANKGYVDSLVGQYSGGFNMFFNYSVVDGVYRQLGNTIVDVAQQSVVTVTNGTRQLIAAFISSALNVNAIPAGIWNVLLYGQIDVATATVKYSYDVHMYDTATTTETALPFASSGTSSEVKAVGTSAAFPINVAVTEQPFVPSNKIVIRLYVQNIGSATPRTVTTYFQSSLYSFTQTTLNAGTTLTSANNNWTNDQTFTPLRMSTSIVYSATTGTQISGSIGFVIQGVSTVPAAFASGTTYDLGNIVFNTAGVYYVTAVSSYRVSVTATINRIETWLTVGNVYNGQAGGGNTATVGNYRIGVSGLVVITSVPTTVIQRIVVVYSAGTLVQNYSAWLLNAVRIS